MDPTKAERGTVATIEIDGLSEPLRNVRQFSVSDDALQVGDTFSAAVPDPRGQLYRKIELFAGYRFYLSNPNIDGGAPSLRQTGIIRSRGMDSSGGGDCINLRGADLGWHLQQSAQPFYRLEQATLKNLLDKLIFDTPEWGFKGLRTSNDANRKLRQGRLGAQIEFINSTLSPFLVIQITPGQRIIDVVQEYARRDGVMVNVSADGYLQLMNPNYNQPASFQVNSHRAGTLDASTNNVLGTASLEENGDLLYTEVTCVWDHLFTGVQEGPFLANPGRHAATYTRSTNTSQDVAVEFGGVTITSAQTMPLSAGPKFPRRFVFADAEPMTPEQGARRAVWQAERMEFDSFVYQARLAGHSQNGRWICSDTLATVNDTIRNVKGVLYAPSVRLDADRAGNNSTYVELRKPGLLSNKRLQLNVVEHRGGGVFVEVQSGQ